MPFIYVILINYNGSADTINCINSLSKSFNSNLKIVIVDNASKEEDLLKLEKFCYGNENIVLIKSNENIGFAAGNNLAIDYIEKNITLQENQYIWFLNNDTLVTEILSKNIKNKLPKDNEVLYFEMRNFNNEIVNDGLNYVSLLTGKYSGIKKKNYCEYICGASIFLKRKTSIPRWDDTYFLYYEDVEYSLDLKKIGYSFIKGEDCYYLHKVNGSSRYNPKTNLFRLMSQKKFMRRHGKNYCLYYIMKVIYFIIKLDFKTLYEYVKL